MTPSPHSTQLARIIAAANRVILGKDFQVRLALACLLARGHLLIEDLPGVGKTTLAHTLARLMGLQFSRIQFTSDMLPADVIGLSIFDRERSDFRFLPGPIFSQVLLADEINRATPKTQSALLEAMEERQVTVEGATTRPLPEPFFVIATQNPSTQIGTFPLPESQLDRFLLRLELGYPDRAAERALLEGGGRREALPDLAAALTPDQIVPLQTAAAATHVSPALLDYVQALVEATRNSRASFTASARARRWPCSPSPAPGPFSPGGTWSYRKTSRPFCPASPAIVCNSPTAPAMHGRRTSPASSERCRSSDATPGALHSLAVPPRAR
jgi:MoxR-like ATPase